MKKLVFLFAVLSFLGLPFSGAFAHEGEHGKHHGKHHEKYRMKHAAHECKEKGFKAGSDEYRTCMKDKKQAMMEKKRENREEHKEKMKEKKSK